MKEMKNVRPAFEKWEKSEGEFPVGYHKINCHFFFDVKMSENFRRKARLDWQMGTKRTHHLR